MPVKFKTKIHFLQIDVCSKLIGHENGAFRKRSANRRNSITQALRFSVDVKLVESLVAPSERVMSLVHNMLRYVLKTGGAFQKR